MSESDQPKRSDDLLREQGFDFEAAETMRRIELKLESDEVAATEPGDDGEADRVQDE